MAAVTAMPAMPAITPVPVATPSLILSSNRLPTTATRPVRSLLSVGVLDTRSAAADHKGGGSNGVVECTTMYGSDGTVHLVAAKYAKSDTPAMLRELAVLGATKHAEGASRRAASQSATGADADIDAASPLALPKAVVMSTHPERGIEIIMPAGVNSVKQQMGNTCLAADLGPTVRIVRGILAAAQCLQDRRIAHNDIKPENMVITASGDTLLVDFGSAVPVAGTTARGGASRFPPGATNRVGLSTLQYAPPLAAPARASGLEGAPCQRAAHDHDAWSTAQTMQSLVGNGDCDATVNECTFWDPRQAHQPAKNGGMDSLSHTRLVAARIRQRGGVDTSAPYITSLRDTTAATLTQSVDTRVRLALLTLYKDRLPGAVDRVQAAATHVYCSARLMVPRDHVHAEGGPPASPFSRVPDIASVRRTYERGTRAVFDAYTAARRR